MEIIDKTKPLSPKYEYVPTPEIFNTVRDKDAYWDLQNERWHNGHAGLTGFHYFYLQEWHIPYKSGYIRPKWRDRDDVLFHSVKEAIDKYKNIIITKPRGYGGNSIFGGCLPVYSALTKGNLTFPFTSANGIRINSNIKNYLEPGIDRMHPEIRLYNTVKNAELRQYVDKEGKEIWDKKLEKKGTEEAMVHDGINLKFLPRKTNSKVNYNAFEGERFEVGAMDEMYIHPNPEIVLNSMDSCMKHGSTRKEGTIVVWGSSNSTLPKSREIVRKLYRQNDSSTILEFVSGAFGCPDYLEDPITGIEYPTYFQVNGHTNIKKATEYILQERERLLKAGLDSKYQQFKIDFPLDIKEVFDIVEEGMFDSELIQSLNEQMHRISITTEFKEKKVDLVEVDGKVISYPNSKGKINIMGEPKVGMTNKDNIFGTDTFPAKVDQDKKGSAHVIIGMDRNTETLNCYYSERVNSIDEIAGNSILMQKYFGYGVNLCENGQAQLLMRLYEENGVYHLLANTPAKASDLYKRQTGIMAKGINPSVGNISEAHNCLVKYLKANYMNIWFHEILFDLIHVYNVYGKSDFGDALKWLCYLLYSLPKPSDKANSNSKTVSIRTMHYVNGVPTIKITEMKI